MLKSFFNKFIGLLNKASNSKYFKASPTLLKNYKTLISHFDKYDLTYTKAESLVTKKK